MPMAREAKEQLLQLFSDDRQNLWDVGYSSSNLSQSPSSGKSFEVVSLGRAAKPMFNICEALLKEIRKE